MVAILVSSWNKILSTVEFHNRCVWLKVCTLLQTTHIRHKRRLHYSSLQPLEVDVFEERVGLDARCSVRLAPQPLLRVFGQQLGASRSRDDSLHYSLFIHLSVPTTFHQTLTILQMALVSSVNLSLYSSSSSCTLLSTSSRFTRSLRARKGDRPAVIS